LFMWDIMFFQEFLTHDDNHRAFLKFESNYSCLTCALSARLFWADLSMHT
jgi:hypothetical protein